MALNEDKKTVLEKYGPYVRSLAVTIRRQFCAQFDVEELVAYGQVGLLEAADRFDRRLGANFLTFAHYRIKGAIFDGLRKMGDLRGPDARAIYLAERANAYLGNLADREQGAGGRMGNADDDFRDIYSAITGLAALFAAGLYAIEAQVPDEAVPADQKLEMEQLKHRVRAALNELPERERKLIEGYYFQGKTLEEAGAEIGQSKSWASRLHARAIEELKHKLGEGDESSLDVSARRKVHGRSNVERPDDRDDADRATKGAGSARRAAGQARGK